MPRDVMLPSAYLARLKPLAPDACICGYDNGCVCVDAEKALRRYAYAKPGDVLPALSPDQREDILDEIAHVEGYDRKDYEAESDQMLCHGVLCALTDYCRDKGLL